MESAVGWEFSGDPYNKETPLRSAPENSHWSDSEMQSCALGRGRDWVSESTDEGILIFVFGTHYSCLIVCYSGGVTL